MRRAYPQHLTAVGQLPSEMLQVIYPLTYWDSIRRHSATYGLDPYVVAALIAQESTFDPGIKSVYATIGADPNTETPEYFADMLGREITMLAPVVRASGAKAE